MDISVIINYLNFAGPYVRALVIFIGFFVVSKIAVYICEKVILRVMVKTKTTLDEKILKKIDKPISFILIIYGLMIALHNLSIPYMGILLNSLHSIVAVILGLVIVSIIDIIIENQVVLWAKKTKTKTDEQVVSLLHRIGKWIIIVFVLVYILGIWGIEVTPLVAGLGIGGIVVGLALQDTLGNLFGGISMILDGSVKKGDTLVLEDGTWGKVKGVGMRSTRIETPDNEILIYPSGRLADSKIHNRAQPSPKNRVATSFGVEYGSDIDEVKRIVAKKLKKLDMVKKEPVVWFMEMGDSALIFKVYFWIDNFEDLYHAKDQANTVIYNALNKEGIVIPFPQMDVHMKK